MPRRPNPSTATSTYAMALVMSLLMTGCDSFVVVSPPRCPVEERRRIGTYRVPPPTFPPPPDDATSLHLFRELLSDDDEDLRTNVNVIDGRDALDAFLGRDDRPCVIKFYAPFCKACRSFGIKFRKLASLRGDRTNAAGTVVKRGDFRFGEVEYSGNVRLCKELSIRTFPAVLIYHRAGGDGMVGVERSREVICGPAIEDVISDIDRLNLVEKFPSHQ